MYHISLYREYQGKYHHLSAPMVSHVSTTLLYPCC